MIFLYPNPVLHMKYSFWRINLYAICRSSYRSRCKRCVCIDEAFWLTESDWCFKKVFETVFDVPLTHEDFLSLTVFAFEGKENALLFCHNWELFFLKQLSYLRPIFVNLSTEKKLVKNFARRPSQSFFCRYSYVPLFVRKQCTFYVFFEFSYFQDISLL